MFALRAKTQAPRASRSTTVAVKAQAAQAPFTLTPPPYPLDALEPFGMSKQTLEFHWGKHHKTYLDNLNNMCAQADSPYKNKDLVTIMLESWNGGKPTPAFNQVAQVINHDFFWASMKPNGGGEPKGALADAIKAKWGSYDAFKAEFKQACLTQFGSGWAWLVKDKDGKLAITKTPNAENPWIHGQTPLLTCDVWEHAYYIDVQNRRADFVDNFLAKLVDWDAVAKRIGTVPQVYQEEEGTGKGRYKVNSLRSGFGKQSDSRMKSSGGFSFGSSTRDKYNKMYISPATDRAQLKSRGGNQSPGAGAYSPLTENTFAKSQVFKQTGSVVFGTSKRLPDARPRSPGPGAYESAFAIGSQVLSNRPTSAMASFGRTDRDQASRVFLTSKHEKANIGKHSPGPGVYETATAIGPSKSMVFQSSPSAVMGRSDKFAMTNYELRKRSMSPGAGAYNLEDAVGKQALSTRKSMSAFSFGGSTRDQAGSVFISSRHEKSQFGKHSPGAGAYDQAGAFNKQALSKSFNAPSATFGKSAKLGLKKSETPGPGSYYAW